MAVYRKKQPARRPVRRGWKRHARTGMFLFAFALVAVTVGVILPHAGVMSAAAEGSTLTEKIFTTVQNKNLPVIAIDPVHGRPLPRPRLRTIPEHRVEAGRAAHIVIFRARMILPGNLKCWNEIGRASCRERV